MMRSLVSLRDAVPEDAEALAELWGTTLRRCDHADQVGDVASIIERVAAGDDERLVIAEHDGQFAGAVHLRATTVTPLNLEPVVQTISPHVLPQFRRRGVGRALMESAIAFAEERGIGLVASAASAGSRDANRFMARLALGPFATFRVAPTHVVKARLTAQRPVAVRTSGRQVTQVLAARRSLRRSAATGS